MINFSKSNVRSWKGILLALGICVLSVSCSSDNSNESKGGNETTTTAKEASTEAPKHGVGPVKEVDLGSEIDPAMAEKGKSLFEAKCSACHKFDQRYVGPALAGVTERRDPAWIMNMIMNPEEMTKKDPVAKKLLAEYMTQMVFQDVTHDETRAILEYFRQVDNQK